MSDGVWAAQLVDPDGHEETISSADPNTIVWWLERQAQRLDPKPDPKPEPNPVCGFMRCELEVEHQHAHGQRKREPIEQAMLRKSPPLACPKADGCDQLALCLADQRCHAIPLSGP